MQKDRLFRNEIAKKFEFDEAVASVFDDMLHRSVPFYETVQALIVALIKKRQKEHMRILDLGSSTASFLLALHRGLDVDAELEGIDNSEAMISRAKKKAQAFGANIRFTQADMLEYPIEARDVIVANYTLQFIRPIMRPKLIKRIYEGLNEGGVFFFSEKVVFEEKRVDKEMIDIYYDFKKQQGYSDYEIAQKREALENVLIPFTIEENKQMCKEAGFKSVETVFQWANFVTFFASK